MKESEIDNTVETHNYNKNTVRTTTGDSAKGDLTQFWELFTLIPCATKDFKR